MRGAARATDNDMEPGGKWQTAGTLTRGSGVAHRPQAEAVGWGEGGGLRAVAPRQDAEDVAGVLAAQAGVHQRADHAADHLVAEGVGLDLEAQDAVAEVVPRGAVDPPHQRRLRAV